MKCLSEKISYCRLGRDHEGDCEFATQQELDLASVYSSIGLFRKATANNEAGLYVGTHHLSSAIEKLAEYIEKYYAGGEW